MQPAAEVDPSARAVGAPVTEADRAVRAAGAPLPCPALPCLKLKEGGRSGFMFAEIWDGLGAEDARSWNWGLGDRREGEGGTGASPPPAASAASRGYACVQPRPSSAALNPLMLRAPTPPAHLHCYSCSQRRRARPTDRDRLGPAARDKVPCAGEPGDRARENGEAAAGIARERRKGGVHGKADAGARSEHARRREDKRAWR
jgi:hypothetical protein